MASNANMGGFRPVTPSPGITPLQAGIVLSASEARKIAEALVTIQQVAGRVGIHLIDKLDVLDGDSDFEGECSEDEISRCTDHGLPIPNDGPGCKIADPREEDDPAGGDVVDERHDGYDEDGI